MKSRKLLWVIASALCVVLMAGSFSAFAGEEAASDLAAIQEKGVLVVGITDFAPMDYKDEAGEWIGFDADLARMFAEEIGVDVEFQEIDWDGKIMELNAGTVDCIWNGMTLTPEVDEAMNCTVPYALNAQVIVMSTDKLADYPDVESMEGLVMAVEAGSAGESVAIENGFEVNSVQTQTNALMEVAAGTSDACIIDMTMAEAMTGEGTSYEAMGYTVSLSEEEYVVGFRKDSDGTEALNACFEKWAQEGIMKEISEKYDNAVVIAIETEEAPAEEEEAPAEEEEAPAEETEAPEGN